MEGSFPGEGLYRRGVSQDQGLLSQRWGQQEGLMPQDSKSQCSTTSFLEASRGLWGL